MTKTTTLEILGWSTRGLRCPDYQITFEKDNENVYPVTLIQMPNGTGKTTTLSLLRAALSGEAEDWKYKKVLSYQKRFNPTSFGEFNVYLRYNGSRITIMMYFDFEEGKVRYFTTTGSDPSSFSLGKDNGFRPPKDCREILNPEFINFFVFDGELAQQLLDPEFSNAEKAIEYLYQLKYFDQIKNAVKSYWDRKVSSTTATGKKGYTQRKQKVVFLEERLKQLKEEKAVLENERKIKKQELLALKQKYEDKLASNAKVRQEYELRKTALENAIKEVNELTQQVIKASRSPHNLSEIIGHSVIELKKSMDKLKLPESTAKEFFMELAEEPVCLCGRPLEHEHRLYIRERATHYLGSDEMTLLNSIKSEITNQIEDPSKCSQEYQDLLEKYNKAIERRMSAATQLDVLKQDAESGDSELADVQKRIESLNNEIANIEERLKIYEDKDTELPDERTFGISVIEKRLEEARERLAEITETITIKRKTDQLTAIIQLALDLSKEQIFEHIKNEANTRISRLMPYNHIRISKVDRALKLEGQEAGSMGETLSVAYAFMATLYNGVERQIPFIVDSPANSIDNNVRTQVAEHIPKLSKQFIAFTISSERGSFVLPLERACNGDIQFFTVFRRGDPSLEELAKKFSNVTYTEDGILVADREFFMNFHKESEADE